MRQDNETRSAFTEGMEGPPHLWPQSSDLCPWLRRTRRNKSSNNPLSRRDRLTHSSTSEKTPSAAAPAPQPITTAPAASQRAGAALSPGSAAGAWRCGRTRREGRGHAAERRSREGRGKEDTGYGAAATAAPLRQVTGAGGRCRELLGKAGSGSRGNGGGGPQRGLRTERHRPSPFQHKAPGPVPGPPAEAGTERLSAAATTFCPAQPPVPLLCLPRRDGGGNFPRPVPALRRVGRPLRGAGAAAGPPVSCSLCLLSSCLRCRRRPAAAPGAEPAAIGYAPSRDAGRPGPPPRGALCAAGATDAPRTRGLPAAQPFAPGGAEGRGAAAGRVRPAVRGIA